MLLPPLNRVKRKLCRCNRCFFQWQDYPGPTLAQHSEHGCPKCGSLYWTETDA